MGNRCLRHFRQASRTAAAWRPARDKRRLGQQAFFAFVTLVRHGRSGRPGAMALPAMLPAARCRPSREYHAMRSVLPYLLSLFFLTVGCLVQPGPALAGPPLKNGVACTGL